MVCQRNCGSVGPFDDVVVRHNMAVLVPDEPRTGPAGDFLDIETEQAACLGQIRDVDHGWSHLTA